MGRKKKEATMPIVNPQAAGIDVGSRSHYVAVGQRAEDVREFGVYSDDLEALCKWLKAEGVTAVALESTGTYWQNLFVMLGDHGLNPILVSGKFTKNVQGKKTDVQDCQYIQKMHTMGLLPSSFQPSTGTEKLRQYVRHRQSLLESGADYIKKVQKALRLMNIRLDIAISDVTGQSGKAIVKAIIEGQTDPRHLAGLANSKIRKSKEELERALTGIWKEEYVLELKHSLELYEFFHAKAGECDVAIEALLEKQIEDNEREDGVQRPHLERKERKKENKNRPKMDIEKLAFQLTGGVDLAKIDGVSGQTLLTVISEVGANVDKFQSAKQFAAWLRLAPNNKKTGGKVISSHTPKRKNRLALALQRAANVIGNNLKKGALHQFFVRIKVKKGYMEAIVATARKLAVIIWNMLSKKQQYQPTEDKAYTERLKVQAIKNIQRKLRRLNISPENLVFN
ncbi:MAG: IS110 family transposase [Saprospiraceae bacterium]|nr:IS110 family transposase [Saprospiraceae bacterium]MCF8282338.1 IS110 family transposase [Bacteroidales bacterium]